jgi:apolipoprotein N-acyltransferase
VNRFINFLARHRYVADHFIWVWIGVAALATSISYFISGRPGSVVTEAIHPYEDIWTAGFGLSGLCLMYGILRAQPHVEAAGLMFFTGALTMYWYWLILDGTNAVGTYTYPALIFAAVLRVLSLVLVANGWRLLRKRVAEEANEIERQ